MTLGLPVQPFFAKDLGGMAFYFCQEAVVLASLPNNTENHCKQLGKLCQTQKYSWQYMNTAQCSFPGLRGDRVSTVHYYSFYLLGYIFQTCLSCCKTKVKKDFPFTLALKKKKKKKKAIIRVKE